MKTNNIDFDEIEKWLLMDYLLNGKPQGRRGYYFSEMYKKLLCNKITRSFPKNRHKDRIINQIWERLSDANE